MRKRKVHPVIQLICPRLPKLFKLSDLSQTTNVDRPDTPDPDDTGNEFLITNLFIKF